MLRYFILFLSILCLTLIFANSAIFHFTVICMRSPIDGSSNVTELTTFSSLEESILFGVVSIGRIIGSYPAIKLHELLGFKLSFTLYGALSAVATLAVPLLGGGFYANLAHRVVQGFVIASAFVALGVIPNACGKKNEKNLFVSLLTCSMQLGGFIIMPTSGAFCSSSVGWPGVYYLMAFLTLILFLLFFFCYTETSGRPKKNKCTDFNELKQVDSVLSIASNEESSKVPYAAICCSPSFWGIMIVAFGDTIGYHVFLQYGPIYINKVLDFDVETTGFLTAVPYLISIGTKAVGGVFLDKATCIRESLRIMLFTSLSQAAMTACFVVLTQITSENAMIGHLMLTMMMIFSGLAYIGLMSGTRIISQQFTYIVTSASSIQDSFAGFLVPALVALVAPNYAKDEWQMVFYILIVLLVVSNAAFVVLTRVRPAKWTK